MERIGRALDFAADHVGDLYFVALAAVAIAGVLLVLGLAVYSAL